MSTNGSRSTDEGERRRQQSDGSRQEHPPRLRHYSTVGIGEVFAEKRGAPLSLEDEMVGTLKAVPEDFIVREIAKPRVAAGGDGDGAERRGGGVGGDGSVAATATVDSAAAPLPGGVVVADLGLRLPPHSATGDIERRQAPAPPPPAADSTAADTTTASEEASPRFPVAPASAGGDDDRDPLDVLRKFFSSAAGNDMEALQRLHREALGEMQERGVARGGDGGAAPSVSNRESASGATKDRAEVLSFVLRADSPEERKRECGEIHQALKHAFPVLKSETVAAASDDGGDGQKQKQYIVRVVIDDLFFDLIPHLHAPAEDLPPVYAFCKGGFEHAQRQQQQQQQQQQHRGGGEGGWRGSRRRRNGRWSALSSVCGPALRLHPDLPRDRRRPVHHAIEAKMKGMVGTQTLAAYPLHDEAESAAAAASSDEAAATTTTAIQVFWTKAAQRRVSKKRKCENGEPPLHTLCVLKKTNREHLVMVKTLVRALHCRQSDIGLAGIKDMRSVSYQFLTLTNVGRRRVERSVDFLRQRGIEIEPIGQVPRALRRGYLVGNRFEIVVRNLCRVQLAFDDGGDSPPGEQFVPVDRTHVQRMAERLRRGGFVNFYGEQRVGEPGPRSIVGVRAFDVGRAMLQQNWTEAIDLIMTGRRLINGVEVVDDSVDSFRRTWKESGGDAEATSRDFPKERSTAPRERTLLKGLKRYGKDKPLTVIRCLQRNERVFFLNAYQAYIWNKMATERIRRFGTDVVAGDLVLFDGSNEVKIVSDLSTACIENVVLPMPGYDTLYPDNEIGRLYEEVLREENICFAKDVPEEAKVKGSYRRLLARAENLSYDFLPSEDNSVVNVKFTFDLPAGAYATMFFRELMFTTVARDKPREIEP